MTKRYIVSPGNPGKERPKPEKDVEKQKRRERSPEIDVGRHSGKEEKPNRVNRKTMR